MRHNRTPSWINRRLSNGTDPDPRFSLANERTFLAWVRTALGLIALGVAVATFVSTQETKGVSLLLAAVLVLLGGILAAGSWWRWLSVERAMRDGHGIPPSTLAPFLAVGIGVISVLAIVAVVITV
jgi:putative membrane protein